MILFGERVGWGISEQRYLAVFKKRESAMWRESFTHAHVHMLRIGNMSPTSDIQTVIQHQTFQSIHDKWLRRDYRPCHHWHVHSYTHVPTQDLSRTLFFFFLPVINCPSISFSHVPCSAHQNYTVWALPSAVLRCMTICTGIVSLNWDPEC